MLKTNLDIGGRKNSASKRSINGIASNMMTPMNIRAILDSELGIRDARYNMRNDKRRKKISTNTSSKTNRLTFHNSVKNADKSARVDCQKPITLGE